MTRPGKRSTAKAGIEPRSAALEVNAVPLGRRGGPLEADAYGEATETVRERGHEVGPINSWRRDPGLFLRTGHTVSSHGRRECGKLCRSCSCLVAEGTTCCLGSCWFSLSERASPEQCPGVLTLRPGVSCVD